MNKSILLIVIVLMVASCGIKKSINIEQISNTNWQLKSIEGLSEEENSTFASATLSFSISDSSYSGNNGCNMISGKLFFTHDKVSFGEGLSTRKFCQGIDEHKFNETLRSTNRMKLSNNVLFLFENDKKLAEFVGK